MNNNREYRMVQPPRLLARKLANCFFGNLHKSHFSLTYFAVKLSCHLANFFEKNSSNNVTSLFFFPPKLSMIDVVGYKISEMILFDNGRVDAVSNYMISNWVSS